MLFSPLSDWHFHTVTLGLSIYCPANLQFPGLPWIWNFLSISISISTDFPWISMDISMDIHGYIHIHRRLQHTCSSQFSQNTAVQERLSPRSLAFLFFPALFAPPWIWNFWFSRYVIFTRESSYCFQCVLAIAILSVCPSVRLSHG